MTLALELRHYRDVRDCRQTLIDLYTDVRAGLLNLPDYAVATFAERLDRHASEPGSEVVNWASASPGEAPVRRGAFMTSSLPGAARRT